MVKKPEITQRLALLAQRPPNRQVGARVKSVLMGTILVGILLGATGSSDYEDNQPEPSPKSIEINSMEVADTEAIVGVQHQTPNADEATETVDVPIAANTQPDQSTGVSTITKKTIADSETPKVSHQAFTVHSHLQPVFPAPSKAGPVNSGQIIHGRVTDIDGLPIPNATLLVGMFSFDAPAALPKNKPMPFVKITTDINGNWNWNQAIAAQALGLRVAKDGYISSSFEFAEGKTAYDIQLAKAISVRGTLVDENGQPVQGLRIFADPYLQFLSRETQSPSRMSAKETDSHGNWQVDTGKQVFSRYLSRSTLPIDYAWVVNAGNCFVTESKRLVRIAQDGRTLCELPLVAKSLAASSDSNALWALTNEGLCKIDISGHGMVVAETIPGVTGDQLLVLE